MISYFKYTGGEAFTLEGDDYSGPFFISNNKAYTGKLSSVDSLELISKNTMMSNFYLNGYEFDTTYKNITPLKKYYSNIFDILNKEGLDKLLYAIDDNNLLCFKNLVLENPTIFKYEENNGHYYGFTGFDSTYVPAMNTYADIIPFKSTNNWRFLDYIQQGTVIVDSNENFKYICTNGNNVYTLSGNFANKTPLTILHQDNNTIYDLNTPSNSKISILYGINQDIEQSRLLFLKDDRVEVYDSLDYTDCDKLRLMDTINLLPVSSYFLAWDNKNTRKFGSPKIKFSARNVSYNPNNPKYIKFGNNIKTGLLGDSIYLSDLDSNYLEYENIIKTLTISNKYSNDLYQSIDLNQYGLSDYTVIDIDVRDIDDNIVLLTKKDNNLYVSFIDPTNIMNPIDVNLLESIDTSLDIQKINYSQVDSNMFYTYNASEYQSRYITNPLYPAGRLEKCDLTYLDDHIWVNTPDKFNNLSIKWNSKTADSNFYNNIITSNSVKNNKMYMLLHNIGRLFALNQPINDRFLNAMPLDLIQYFENVPYSESSLGLYFNSAISNIIKDLLNMFNKLISSFTIEEEQVILKQLEDISLETDNFYLNGNETINVISLQRILLAITNLQEKLLPS